MTQITPCEFIDEIDTTFRMTLNYADWIHLDYECIVYALNMILYKISLFL